MPKKSKQIAPVQGEPPKRLKGEDEIAKFKELAPFYDLSNPILAETIALYAEQFGLYCRAKREYEQSDALSYEITNGAHSQNASVKIADNALTQMQRLQKLMGKPRSTVDPNKLDLD